MLGTLRAAARPLARQPSRSLHLLFGACGIPHPSKVAKGGEDAFFCDEAKGTFGVADGVGGSASAFVDPGEFSRALLRSCDERLDGSCEALRAVLAGTAQRLREAPVAGSSTLLVGQLEPEGATLRLLNIGDCGAMLLRPAARRFRAGGTVAWPRVVLRTTAGADAHLQDRLLFTPLRWHRCCGRRSRRTTSTARTSSTTRWSRRLAQKTNRDRPRSAEIGRDWSRSRSRSLAIRRLTRTRYARRRA